MRFKLEKLPKHHCSRGLKDYVDAVHSVQAEGSFARRANFFP